MLLLADYYDPRPPCVTVHYTHPARARRPDGSVRYTHTVLVLTAGRVVGTDEAVDEATTNARRFGIDTTALHMDVTTIPATATPAERSLLAPAEE